MRKSIPLNIILYILNDLVASVIVWLIISVVRKHLLNEQPQALGELLATDPVFLRSLIIAPFFWLVLYAVTGSYNNAIYQKSRLTELTNSVIQALAGSAILLFVLFINDRRQDYSYLYIVFFSLLALQTFIPFAGRYILIMVAKKHIRQGRYFLNTIIIGNNRKSHDAFAEIRNYKESGCNIVGYLTLEALTIWKALYTRKKLTR